MLLFIYATQSQSNKKVIQVKQQNLLIFKIHLNVMYVYNNKIEIKHPTSEKNSMKMRMTALSGFII